MAKVKDFSNWRKVVLQDRAILKQDLLYMSWSQIRKLDELEVLSHEQNKDGTVDLIVEPRT